MKKRILWMAAVMAAMVMTGCSDRAASDLGTSTEAVNADQSTQASVQALTETLTDTLAQSESEKEGIANTVLRMATTTSTADTGLLDYLAPLFQKETGYELQWTSVGTGEAIKLGENGDVDIILVHSKASEETFVADGYGVERFPVMYNDFIVVGPTDKIPHNEDVRNTFLTILNEQFDFVSRGDDSGTHKKELNIWKALEADPATNPNYVESGQGMGATITMADEKNAFTLTDRGTWLKMKTDADLSFRIDVVSEGAADLLNQYGVIAVNPKKHPNVNIDGANAFIEWICSENTQKLIGEYGISEYGQALFIPNANQ